MTDSPKPRCGACGKMHPTEQHYVLMGKLALMVDVLDMHLERRATDDR